MAVTSIPVHVDDVIFYFVPVLSASIKKESMMMMDMDVGGASFTPTKLVIRGDHHLHHHKTKHQQHHAATTPTMAAATTTTLLVAKGRSYLSYFYVGVCSSVLYLPPEITNNEEAIMSLLDNANHSNNAVTKRKKWNVSRRSSSSSVKDRPPIVVMALEIYYHKPVRATELRWATNKFIEANLVGALSSSHNNNKNNKIANLPRNIQHHLSSFNDLYQNIKVGDRYTLEYHPEVGIRLYLNHVLLGTVGNNHHVDNNNNPDHHHNLRDEERVVLARIIFSVWFGNKSPFSEVMKRELLTPIVPPVMVPPVGNGMLPSRDYHHQNRNHHVVAHASTPTWYTQFAQKQCNAGAVLEFVLALLGIIVALALWILIRRRKTPSTNTIEVKTTNVMHHPASSYYSRVQHLFDVSNSRGMVTLTEEEIKMLDFHGVCHLLAMYYNSLRDVAVSAA